MISIVVLSVACPSAPIRAPDALRCCQQSNWIRTRHERESGAAVAIFVLLYFRAYVIDSISPHHSSFHDKRRGVEVEEQADAKAGCTAMAASMILRKAARSHGPRSKCIPSRSITKTQKYENTKNSRTGTLHCLGCHRPLANAAFGEWILAPLANGSAFMSASTNKCRPRKPETSKSRKKIWTAGD